MLLDYFKLQDDFLVIYFGTLILQDHWQQAFRNVNWNGFSRKCCSSDIIQGIYKRMVRFQKLTRNLFLTLHSTTGRCCPPPPIFAEITSASQSCSSTALDRTCCKRRQPPAPLATPFAGSNTM